MFSVQLTLFQAGGGDYAHHITTYPPGFENLTASLDSYTLTLYVVYRKLTFPSKIRHKKKNTGVV